MNPKASVLVVGATGTVGREVARATLARGAHVRALVRSTSAELPAEVETVHGDLRDESLSRAAAGVHAIFYPSPHEPDEEALAARMIEVANRARARLVFVGVHLDGGSRISRGLQRWLFGRVVPHYRPKFRLSERIRVEARESIVLMPTNFFQNDEPYRASIEAGVLPLAFEKRVNRVDVRDLGEAAARALLDESIAPGAYPVVGPASLTSAECAAIWSAVLGRPVRDETDPEALRTLIAGTLHGKKREDFLATFEVLRTFELPTKARDLERTTALLGGRAPTAYRAYVERTVATWRKSEVRLAS